MKLRWILLLSITLAVLLVTVDMAVMLLVDDRRGWVVLVTMVSTMMLVIAPAIAGFMVVALDFDRDSSSGRRTTRRVVQVVAAVQGLGILGLVFVAVAAPEPTVLFVALGALSVVVLVGSARFGLPTVSIRGPVDRTRRG